MTVASQAKLVFALAALVPLGSGLLPSCSGEAPAVYCLFENEALQGGACLTECQSRCNLEALAGCVSTTCVTDCEKANLGQSDVCLDASYTYWRCLRTSGQPQVTCHDDAAVFSVNEDTCQSQLQMMHQRCPAADAGADAG